VYATAPVMNVTYWTLTMFYQYRPSSGRHIHASLWCCQGLPKFVP